MSLLARTSAGENWTTPNKEWKFPETGISALRLAPSEELWILRIDQGTS